MTTCTHIIGNAWMLNPEEGQAWITRFVPAGATPESGDMLYRFAFCPCCGEKMQEPDDTTLKMESATWR